MEPGSASFERLVTIMDELREKCPWDKKQTIQSLRQLTLEETYELTEAITEEDWKSIKEKLERSKKNLRLRKLSMEFPKNLLPGIHIFTVTCK
jgi:hypothetical protein